MLMRKWELDIATFETLSQKKIGRLEVNVNIVAAFLKHGYLPMDYFKEYFQERQKIA